MKKRSLVSPSFLKQKARQLKREKFLSQSQALDEAAQQFGFSNYKNYLNILESNQKQSKPPIEDILKNIFLENDMSKKMELAILNIQKFEMPFHELLDIFKLFQHSEGDMRFIYEKLNLDKDFHDLIQPNLQYMGEKLNLMKAEIQSYLLKDFLTDEGESEIQFRHPYFIAKEISLHDLTYTIDVDVLCVNGQLDLKLKFDSEGFCLMEGSERIEFGSEVPDRYKEEPHFKDRLLFGAFVINIDRNKKITILHSEIAEKIDGFIYKSRFRPTVKTFPAIRCP